MNKKKLQKQHIKQIENNRYKKKKKSTEEANAEAEADTDLKAAAEG